MLNSHKVKAKNKVNKNIQFKLVEVVFLDYIRQYRVENELTNPVYFKEELEINDVKGLIKKLIRKGYLIKKDGATAITDEGILFLKKNEDYLAFFKLGIPYVTINEYQRWKNKLKKEYKFEEIMITLLLDKIKILEKQDDFHGVKNMHYDVGDLFEKCGYRGQAIYHYITALYLSVSGIEYYDKFLSFIEKKIKKEELKNTYTDIYIEPYIIKSIKRVGEKYSDAVVDAVYEKNKISINLCPREKCKEIVEEIIEGQFKIEIWQGWFKAAFNVLVNAAEKKIYK